MLLSTVSLNALSIYLLAGAVCSVFWAVRVRTLNESEYSYALLLLGFALCFYLLGYTMELNASSPAQVLFWNALEYLGIPFVSALWLITALVYTGRLPHNRRVLLIVVLVMVPVVTTVLRLTNDFHHLYFAALDVVEFSGELFLVKTPGPWYYVQMVYSLLTIAIALGLFVRAAKYNGRWQKGKALYIAVASAFAVVGLMLVAFRPFGQYLDYMVLLLPLASTAIVCAIVQYDFLETRSIARNRVFEASANAVLLIDREYKILDYNDAARALFARIGVRLRKGYLSSLFDKGSDLPAILKSTEPSVLTVQNDGSERYYRVTTTNIDENNAFRGWIKTLCDITEMHKLNEELRKQALTDELSMLGNRRAFIKAGEAWVLRAEERDEFLCLLMMDLDHFKSINDQYGHLVGDLVIRQFSEMMSQAFCVECLVARLGGEEFAVLRRGLESEAMRKETMEFLRDARHKVYRYQNCRFQVTVSIGMTMKQPGQTLEGMMGRADKALYESKGMGRNKLIVR